MHLATLQSYGLLITRRNASEILVLPSGSEWSLPRTEIPAQQRPAELLTANISRTLQVESYCLFTGRISRANSTEPSVSWALMEVVKQNGAAPAGTHWTPIAAVTNCCNKETADICKQALNELDLYASGQQHGPFGKPGWLGQLFSWAQEQIDPLGMRLTGSFRQLNASPTFSLIRLETGDGALWFKGTGAPNGHELAIALTVARLFPSFVPRIVGVHSTWNGWLSAEAPGPSLDEVSDRSVWERAASDVAELQIASIGKCAELLQGKCKDLRTHTVAECIDQFCERMRELMAIQEKESPPPLARSELNSLQQALREACELLGSFHLPDTLGHIDCNPGNIIVSSHGCVFLDWAEGCVSHPFITFEYLRQHVERSNVNEPGLSARLTNAYLRPWEAFFSPEELARAMAVAALFAVFTYAVANNRWRSPEILHDSASAGYLRALARRMYREAINAANRSEACLESL